MQPKISNRWIKWCPFNCLHVKSHTVLNRHISRILFLLKILLVLWQ